MNSFSTCQKENILMQKLLFPSYGINRTELCRLYLVSKRKKSVEIMVLKNGLTSNEQVILKNKFSFKTLCRTDMDMGQFQSL